MGKNEHTVFALLFFLLFWSTSPFVGYCDNNLRYGKSIPSGTFCTVSNRTVFSMHVKRERVLVCDYAALQRRNE